MTGYVTSQSTLSARRPSSLRRCCFGWPRAALPWRTRLRRSGTRGWARLLSGRTCRRCWSAAPAPTVSSPRPPRCSRPVAKRGRHSKSAGVRWSSGEPIRKDCRNLEAASAFARAHRVLPMAELAGRRRPFAITSDHLYRIQEFTITKLLITAFLLGSAASAFAQPATTPYDHCAASASRAEMATEVASARANGMLQPAGEALVLEDRPVSHESRAEVQAAVAAARADDRLAPAGGGSSSPRITPHRQCLVRT